MVAERQKRPEDLAYRRGGRGAALEVVGEERRVEFPMPDGLSAEAQYVWQETMALAEASLMPTDFFQARRWIYWVERWLREARVLALEPSIVEGALGEVRNPRFMVIRQIEGNIVHAEQVMGLDPRARMRLGITYKQEQDALDALKARREGRKPTRMPAKRGSA